MAGEPLGAGMVLGNGIVLTCAHVVSADRAPISVRELEVLVTFVGLPGSPSVRATVLPGCWAPQLDDDSADVALLRLAPGAPEVRGAPLHWLPDPPHRTVRAFGFPDAHRHGVWAFGTLAGPSGPGDEWVQLDSQLPGQRVRRGFSGSGVIDDLTSAVVGMVVTMFTEETERLAWMIPVDTIVRYVGEVAQWVGADLPRRRPGGVAITLGGPIAKGVDPWLGAIRTTVNTAGKTPGDVHRRIEGRLSTVSGSEPTDVRKAPVTVALAGIDESSQPDALLHNIAKPLLDTGTEVEFQFSREDSPGLAVVRQWQHEEIVSRLGKLAARVDEVDAVEAGLRERAATIARIAGPVPRIPWHAVDLQLSVRALASADSGTDPSRVRRALVSTERKAERALRALGKVRGELAVVQPRYEELKGLLRGYNARARDHGLLEDERLSVLYRPAAQEIAATPCWLPRAEQLVDTYVRAVRRRLNGGTGEPR